MTTPAGPSPSLNRAIDGFSPYVSGNSLESAKIIVPLILKYVPARSVVDFGCKHGEWLPVFKAHGVGRVLGFDQQKRRDRIIVQPAEFRVADLREPLTTEAEFDLAICIEVAEHLPPSAAAVIVRTVTTSAPVALFSAAVPHQGGHGHLNEQPRHYWHDLFRQRGFRPLDCVRPRIWQDPRIAWWYRQNLFVYANAEAFRQHRELQAEAERPVSDDLDLLHSAVLRRSSALNRFREAVSGWLASKRRP